MVFFYYYYYYEHLLTTTKNRNNNVFVVSMFPVVVRRFPGFSDPKPATNNVRPYHLRGQLLLLPLLRCGGGGYRRSRRLGHPA